MPISSLESEAVLEVGAIVLAISTWIMAKSGLVTSILMASVVSSRTFW